MRFLAIILITFTSVSLAFGMDFSVRRSPNQQNWVVIGEGPIEVGDGRRLSAALSQVDRPLLGTKVLYLNSEGGSVAGAFEMVRVMDREGVTTIVTSGGACASACAQIVFVSGKYNYILGDGLIGLHTCYRATSKQPSAFCNEEIAQNALAHGIDHGSVMAWQTFIGPDDMVWLNGDRADCYGLTKWPEELLRAATDKPLSYLGQCWRDAFKRKR